MFLGGTCSSISAGLPINSYVNTNPKHSALGGSMFLVEYCKPCSNQKITLNAFLIFFFFSVMLMLLCNRLRSASSPHSNFSEHTAQQNTHRSKCVEPPSQHQKVVSLNWKKKKQTKKQTPVMLFYQSCRYFTKKKKKVFFPPLIPQNLRKTWRGLRNGGKDGNRSSTGREE